MPSATQTRRILIKVDTSDARGLREIADQMGLLNKNTKTLSGNMAFLTNVFRGWLGFLGVRELARMSDEMQNLTNKLKVVAQDGENIGNTLERLNAVASRTNQSLAGVGEIYTRMANALKGSKVNSEELITLTESLINMFRVAGATTTETTATIVQLSQAFSSGELRGQELRSVMEQNATLAAILKERFGRDIYKKAADGAIRVTDVLRALYENQEKVNTTAAKMAPTFEQTLTKSMNSLQLVIGNLNEKFGLSAKFATIMAFAIENLGNALAVAAPILIAWGLTYIPMLIKQIQVLRAATIAFAAANPLLLAFTAITAAGLLIYNNWDKLSMMLERFRATILDFTATVEEKFLPLREKMANFLGIDMSGQFDKTKKGIVEMRAQAEKIRAALRDKEAQKPGGMTPEEEAKKNMESLLKKMEAFDKLPQKTQKIKEVLGQLNQELLSGAITAGEYSKKLVDFELYKLNREFREGKFDVFEYNKRLRDLKLDQLDRDFKNGIITVQQFNEKVSGVKIEELNKKFEGGKLTLVEYNTELAKISDKFNPQSALIAGAGAYIQSIGTLSDGIAKSIEKTFSHLEDNFLEFIKVGEFNFNKFAQSIMDDLLRIIIRASIIKPLAEGLLGAFTPSSTGTQLPASGVDYSTTAATGAAFENGIRKFAKGGLVDSPTMFKYGGGKNGLMGEAGTEAILPLQRGSNGNLGVQASVAPVVVNIINQTGADVQQSESTGPNGEKMLDILIINKVRDGLTRGKFDKEMAASYGARRKGM